MFITVQVLIQFIYREYSKGYSELGEKSIVLCNIPTEDWDSHLESVQGYLKTAEGKYRYWKAINEMQVPNLNTDSVVHVGIYVVNEYENEVPKTSLAGY